MNESLEELQQLCSEWQERLRLQHWDVEIEIVELKGISRISHAAEILMDDEHRKAKIRYVPVDARPDSWLPDPETEELIVHELLHLHFFGFNTKDGSPEGLAEEQMTHLLARLLVQLKWADSIGLGVIRESLNFKASVKAADNVQRIKEAAECLAEVFKLRHLQVGVKIEVEVRTHPRIRIEGSPCTDVS